MNAHRVVGQIVGNNEASFGLYGILGDDFSHEAKDVTLQSLPVRENHVELPSS